MRALVTGASGFIGSHLVERLLAEGAQVKCLVRRHSNLRWLKNLPVILSPGDFQDPASLARAVRDVEEVYHVAGATRAARRAEYFRANHQATVNLLRACRDHGPPGQKFIFISSLAAAGPSAGEPLAEDTPSRPVSAYGASKLLAEQAVLNFSRQRSATIIRPPVVYGPRDQEALLLFRSVQRGFHIIPGRGAQRLSLVHIQDLVAGILLASRRAQGRGEIYYLSGEQDCDWQDLGECLGRVLGRRVRTLYAPGWMIHLAGLAGAAISQLSRTPALWNLDKVKEIRQTYWLCSCRKARMELGFQPVMDLSEGLTATAAWYRRMGWL